MARYLLAAEADQIQDFVFRASRLREVVGGSQLLSRFCKKGAVEMLKQYGGDPAKDIVINDGGAFRIFFNDRQEDSAKQKANEFGRDLAELYRRIAGGNLTVSEPVSYNGDFQKASQQAQEGLRDAKSRGDVSATTVHLPYLAFCASCGIAIAAKRYKRHRDERQNYYCSSCHQKDKERDSEVRKLGGGKDTSEFLGVFYQAVLSACEAANVADIPEAFPQDADDIAGLDLTGRRYIAYLLADGNGMGTWFSACPNEETMRALSLRLPTVLRDSLAIPCSLMLQRIPVKSKNQVLPILPLILGGDDLFALLPGPWAIDFAARFCCEYEERMKQELQKLNLLTGESPPTIASAVVICKANYPYGLAHKLGDELLAEAKQLARGLKADPDMAKRMDVSVLNFALITGNEVGQHDVPDSVRYRSTARPYFISENLDDKLMKVGGPIQLLLKHRLFLSNAGLPGKRRAEFERLYDDAMAIRNDTDLKDQWKRHFDALLYRMGRTKSETRDAVESTLRELGDRTKDKIGYWRFFERPLGKGFHGHGLPDLLTVWNYAYDLEKDLTEYEE